jgi:hypothetical protein
MIFDLFHHQFIQIVDIVRSDESSISNVVDAGDISAPPGNMIIRILAARDGIGSKGEGKRAP